MPKTKAKFKSKIEVLDRDFQVIDGGEVESGNVKVTLKNGVEVVFYVDDQLSTIYVDINGRGYDRKSAVHELVLVGGHDTSFEISTRKVV